MQSLKCWEPWNKQEISNTARDTDYSDRNCCDFTQSRHKNYERLRRNGIKRLLSNPHTLPMHYLKHLSLLCNSCSRNSTANHLKPSDYLCATGFNIQTFYIVPREWGYVFTDLRINDNNLYIITWLHNR